MSHEITLETVMPAELHDLASQYGVQLSPEETRAMVGMVEGRTPAPSDTAEVNLRGVILFADIRDYSHTELATAEHELAVHGIFKAFKAFRELSKQD